MPARAMSEGWRTREGEKLKESLQSHTCNSDHLIDMSVFVWWTGLSASVIVQFSL